MSQHIMLRKRTLKSVFLVAFIVAFSSSPSTSRASILEEISNTSSGLAASAFSSGQSLLAGVGSAISGVWNAITDPLSDALVPLFLEDVKPLPVSPTSTTQPGSTSRPGTGSTSSGSGSRDIAPGAGTSPVSGGNVVNYISTGGLTQADLNALESRIVQQINALPRGVSDVRPSSNTTIVTSSSGGGTWGSITGTLSGQTDLQAALDAKISSQWTTLSSNIYFSTASVGVGTTTPFGKLSVAGSDTSTTLFAADALTGFTGNLMDLKVASTTKFSVSGFGFGTTTVSGLNISGSATTTSNVGYNITTGCFAIDGTCVGGSSSQWTTNSSDIYFNTGNVGIGTTSPFAKLSIAGAAGGTTPVFAISTSTAGYATSTAFLVDANGNIGIGTTTLDTALSVQGALTVIDSTGYSSLGYGNTISGLNALAYGTNNISNSNGAYSISMGRSNTTSQYGVAIGYSNTANTTNDNVAMGTSNSASGSASSAFGYGNSAGGASSVAFGKYNNTYPTFGIAFGISNMVQTGNTTGIALGYSNTINASGAIAVGNSITNGTADSLMIGPSDASKLTILSSGNVGIGTTSPYTKLSVVGEVAASHFTATTTNTSTFGGNIAIAQGQAITSTPASFYLATGGNATVLNVAGNGLYINDFTGSGELFRITPSTNVGIGTTSPYTKLGVAGQITADNIWATSTSANYFAGNVGIGTTSPSAMFAINPTVGVGDPVMTIGSTTASIFNVYGSGEVFIGNADGVAGTGAGLGICERANAGYRFDLRCYGNVAARFASVNGGSASFTVSGSSGQFTNEGGDFYINNSGSSGDIIYRTNPAGGGYQEPMRIDGATNYVGVGSTSPWALLSVNPNGISGPAFAIGSSTATKFLVSNAGNVSIGTSTASTSLNVVGKIENLMSSNLNPVRVGTATLSGAINGVAVVGDYAYVANNGSSAFEVYNVSTTTPWKMGTVSVATPREITIAGRYAYVTSWGGSAFYIIDISIPNKPTLVSTNTTGTTPWDIAVVGRYAYVSSTLGFAFEVWDVSNPVTPVRLSTTATGLVRDIVVSGRFAFVADSGNNVYVFDITKPSAPVTVSTIDTAIAPDAIDVQGNYLYVMSSNTGNMKIYDVSNTSSATLVSTTNIGSSGISMRVSGRYLYVTSGNTLKVVDVYDPRTPIIVGTVDTGTSPWHMAVSGRHVYIGAVGSNRLEKYEMYGVETNVAQIHMLETGRVNVRNSLDVAGNANIFGGLNIGTGGIFSNGPIAVLSASTTLATSSRLSATFSDYVGIGTTTPWGLLSVNAGSIGTGPILAIGSSTATQLLMDNRGYLGVGTTSPWALMSINAPIGVNSFAIGSSSATSFLVDSLGKIGIGTAAPGRSLDVYNSSSNPQFRISQSGANYAELTVDSGGDLTINATGGDILATDHNLFICAGGACPTGSPSAKGTIVAETALGVGSSTPFAAISVGADGSILTTEKTVSVSASITINWLQGNQQEVTLNQAGHSIAFSNITAGGALRLVLCQDGTGSRTVTGWDSRILWAGGSAPTLTATANKCDVVTFLATSATGTLTVFGSSVLNF